MFEEFYGAMSLLLICFAPYACWCHLVFKTVVRHTIIFQLFSNIGFQSSFWLVSSFCFWEWLSIVLFCSFCCLDNSFRINWLEPDNLAHNRVLMNLLLFRSGSDCLISTLTENRPIPIITFAQVGCISWKELRKKSRA